VGDVGQHEVLDNFFALKLESAHRVELVWWLGGTVGEDRDNRWHREDNYQRGDGLQQCVPHTLSSFFSMTLSRTQGA
jgi:hypothetical protein